MRALFVPFLRVMGVVSIGNGAWMLTHAWSWFTWLPGVADTGAANAHFIHDVGVVYLLSGAGFFWCAANLPVARPVFVFITAFFALHALGHGVEILLGMLPASHWWIDLPLVFAPAAILAWLAWPSTWRRLAPSRGGSQ